MTLQPRRTNLVRHFSTLLLFSGLGMQLGLAQSTSGPSQAASCRIESTDYKGWHAEQLSNRWVQLIVVPQNGGRLMQVSFAGHPYLFVNPQLTGKYLPPTSGQCAMHAAQPHSLPRSKIGMLKVKWLRWLPVV